MQNIAGQVSLGVERRASSLAHPFTLSGLAFCAATALLIGSWPLQLSIVTVLLFAGPHNWMELRYFLSRMPARWGKSRLFYSVGLAGVGVLTCAYVTLYLLGQSWYLDQSVWAASISGWNTLLLLWLSALLYVRGRQVKGRDWSWVFAVGFALCALAWLCPLWFSLGLVYLHPLVALWFLDRQLKRTRPQWRRGYHFCLLMLPVMLCLMWAGQAGAQDIADGDALSWRITQHAGAGLLSNVPSRLLVSTHVFLETIHYGVWLVLIPLTGLSAKAWRAERMPLAARGGGLARVVKAALCLSVLAVLALWAGFAVDYPTTRDVYFTFAMAHVLAEAPFLIRLL
jgi:hypothetical protein